MSSTFSGRLLVLIALVALVASACSGSESASDATGERVAAAPSATIDDDANSTDAENENNGDTSPSAEDTVTSEPQPTQPATPDPEATAQALETAATVAARYTSSRFGSAPPVPDGPLADDTADAIETLMGQRLLDRIYDEKSDAAIDRLGASGDPRVAWWLSDMLRIARDAAFRNRLTAAIEQLVERDITGYGQWREVTDHLIAWDIPAPPNYLDYKRNAYLLVEPKWEALFVDDADIDWRYLSWGGVLIDDRPFDETDIPCNCIPAADNPPTTSASDGDDWLDPDTIVFGVEINGEARAYPRSAMEIREMVNDTLGGRDFAMPYCTLCGSAQVYLTDGDVGDFDRPIMRTSGLLIRSNKVMYEVTTSSIFDTFKGRAVSGPMHEAGIELPQHSVVTTTWSEWKQAHPETTVLAKSVALGRADSDLRNSRDGNGPIFPIGIADDRLGVQADVLGVITSDGSPLAFDVDTARALLGEGATISVDGIDLILDGGGVRAVDQNGDDVGGHQAFWFAWSQFYPDTELWTG